MSELPPQPPPLADGDEKERAAIDASDLALQSALDSMLENALKGPQVTPEKAAFLAKLPKLNSRSDLQAGTVGARATYPKRRSGMPLRVDGPLFLYIERNTESTRVRANPTPAQVELRP